MTIVPAVLATLAITYFIPEDVLSCRLEHQWQNMWKTKDARSIRTVQDRLQCCGLRSERDRAWPFPKPGQGAEDSCPSVYGYDRSCMVPWAQEQRRVATLIFISIMLATFMKVGSEIMHQRLPHSPCHAMPHLMLICFRFSPGRTHATTVWHESAHRHDRTAESPQTPCFLARRRRREHRGRCTRTADF